MAAFSIKKRGVIWLSFAKDVEVFKAHNISPSTNNGTPWIIHIIAYRFKPIIPCPGSYHHAFEWFKSSKPFMVICMKHC